MGWKQLFRAINLVEQSLMEIAGSRMSGFGVLALPHCGKRGRSFQKFNTLSS